MPSSFKEFLAEECSAAPGSQTPDAAGNVSHARDKAKKKDKKPVTENVSEPDEE
ncbi:hypothetical protein VPHD528_0177 [Vibrio phage D528]